MYIWLVRINKINFEVAKSAVSYCQISHVPRVCDALITLHTLPQIGCALQGGGSQYFLSVLGGGSDS